MSGVRILADEFVAGHPRRQERGTPKSVPGPAGRVLQLQRAAGNRAVCSLVTAARGDITVVQRAPISDYDDGKPLHDPSRLTDAQIQASDEYIAYMAMNPMPIPMRDVEPAEALLACRLFLRHLRQSPTPVAVTRAVLDHWLSVARSRMAVTATAEGAVGQQGWVQVNAGDVVKPGAAASDFMQWMLAGGRQPDPRTGRLNCWEMVLFSAFRAGCMTEAQLRGLYTRARDAMAASGDPMTFPRTLEASLRSTSEQIYDPTDSNSPRPLRGDLVIFQEAAGHVALATGRRVGGRIEIISHWPPPDGDHHVKTTTIEALLPAVGVRVAKFWSPVW